MSDLGNLTLSGASNEDNDVDIIKGKTKNKHPTKGRAEEFYWTRILGWNDILDYSSAKYNMQ